MKVDLTRLERIDFLIRTKSTGTPREFAARLGLSVRAWHSLKGELVGLGVEIIYSKRYKTYYYADKERIMINFRRN